MSSVFVLKRQCQRCPAVQEVVVTTEDIKAGKIPAESKTAKYAVVVDGKTIASYSELCEACEEAVSKAILDIARKREKKSSKRT